MTYWCFCLLVGENPTQTGEALACSLRIKAYS